MLDHISENIEQHVDAGGSTSLIIYKIIVLDTLPMKVNTFIAFHIEVIKS